MLLRSKLRKLKQNKKIFLDFAYYNFAIGSNLQDKEVVIELLSLIMSETHPIVVLLVFNNVRSSNHQLRKMLSIRQLFVLQITVLNRLHYFSRRKNRVIH